MGADDTPVSQPGTSSQGAMVVGTSALSLTSLWSAVRRYEIWILRISAVVLAVLWLWDVGPGGRLRRWELGTVAEALGGLAAAVTLGYLVWDRHQERIRQRESERLRQAQQITAWCRSAVPTPAPDGSLIVDYELEIKNASDSAVYSASASVGESFEERGWFVGGSAGVLSSIAPGSSQVVHTNLGFDSADEPSFPPPILLKFTDAAGRVWWRTSDGRLKELGTHMRESLVPWWIPSQAERPIDGGDT